MTQSDRSNREEVAYLEHDPGAHVAITYDLDRDELPPIIWVQPGVRGASMCLGLTASDARRIARYLTAAADRLDSLAMEKVGL